MNNITSLHLFACAALTAYIANDKEGTRTIEELCKWAWDAAAKMEAAKPVTKIHNDELKSIPLDYQIDDRNRRSFLPPLNIRQPRWHYDPDPPAGARSRLNRINNQLPTQPGLYWCRSIAGWTAILIHNLHGKGLVAMIMGRDWWEDLNSEQFAHKEWYGPILNPTES